MGSLSVLSFVIVIWFILTEHRLGFDLPLDLAAEHTAKVAQHAFDALETALDHSERALHEVVRRGLLFSSNAHTTELFNQYESSRDNFFV